MRRLIVIPVVLVAAVFLTGFSISAHSQSPGADLKPTFISPSPGLYVNGWPAFTVSYPKEWVNIPSPAPFAVFQAMNNQSDLPPSHVFTIGVFPHPLPLEDWAKLQMPFWVNVFTDIKILSDRPSQLKDGTTAWEVEVEFVPKTVLLGGGAKDARKNSGILLMTKKDAIWVQVWVSREGGRVDEDLRRVVYSLAFQPDREKPLEVSPDVRAFLDMWCTDRVSHDTQATMQHFSNRFSHNGVSRAQWEQFSLNDPLFPFRKDVISCKSTVTVFELRGDRAYVDGFFVSKAKGDGNAVTAPLAWQQIIKEQGQWKWFGNQK